MDSQFRIFAIDDDPVVLELLTGLLSDEYAMTSFETAESCKAALLEGGELPNLLLLDIGLPGMDGYEFCRWLKNEDTFRAIPVIFVSAHDTIDARLAGYSAGAEDFIVKPFDPTELFDKVKVAQRIAGEIAALKEQAQSAEHLTTLVLTSMEESGIVLQFLSKIVSSTTEQEVAASFLQLLSAYRLHGAVQTRVGERCHTLSASGTNLPLEVSILDHVRTMERIFEFKNRSVFNFPRVTVLVNNMPVEDAELCGRLRDNLAIAAQGAEGRLGAIEAEEANRRHHRGVLAVLESVGRTLANVAELRRQDQRLSSEIMYELQEDMARLFVNLGLTTAQENQIEDLVKGYIERLVVLFDRGSEQQTALEDLNRRLASLVKEPDAALSA